MRGLTRSLGAIGSRFGWGVADQALSSITNFVLGLLAARTLPTADFGAFAVVFAVYLLALGTVRAISSEPMVIRLAAVSTKEWQRGTASSTGTAVVLGFVGGLTCIIAGVLTSGSLGAGLIMLGITLPGLLLQDTWRFGFFAKGRGSASFLNDLVWALALVVGLGAVLRAGSGSVEWFVLAWGGAGTTAGLFGMWQASILPKPGHTLEWGRQHKDLIPRFIGEFSVTTVVGQVTVFGLGAIAGLAEVGILRAGQILLGPLNVLFLGISIVAVPEGARILLGSPRRLLRMCQLLSVILAVSAVLLGGVLWLLPDAIGQMILQENWEGAHSVVVPLALGMALFGLILGAGVGLRSLAAARWSLRARLMTAPLLIIGGLGGAALAGATGAAWGGVAGGVAAATIWWHFLLSALNDQAAQEPDPSGLPPIHEVDLDVPLHPRLDPGSQRWPEAR